MELNRDNCYYFIIFHSLLIFLSKMQEHFLIYQVLLGNCVELSYIPVDQKEQ